MEWVKKNFELVVVAIIFVSVLPMIVEFVLAWRQRKARGKNNDGDPEPAKRLVVESLTSTRQAS